MPKEIEKTIDFEKPDRQLFHEFLLDTSLDGFEAQVSFMANFAGVPILKAQKRAKKEFMRWLATTRVCLAEGHQWEVEGHFGPDTGSEYATCTRCGESHSHCYY